MRLDYGIKEITFDEERLFAFGEQLGRQVSFTGEDATAWGPGYAWEELRPLLEALLEEGIVARGDGDDDPRGGGLVPSLLPPSVCPEPRGFSLAECESIFLDLAGHAVEIGHLESVLPIYRIAHSALDADDRQVGEGNVFPRRLRLDRETEWRTCQYSGSRYRDALPMNITALRAMIKHWKPMMAALRQVRAEVQARTGRADGPWSMGELHVLSVAVLALPTYQLMKRGGTSPQAPLHPVLSSLFRITDGIRMTAFEMLFSIDHNRPSEDLLTAADVYEHAEHHGTLIGETGVCAGPRPMLEEFLAIAVDGVVPEGIADVVPPAEVQALLSELPAVVDYALHGLQVWGTSLSVWLAMSRAYQQILAILDAGAPHDDAALRARLRADWAVLQRMQITLDYDRAVHLEAYRDGYERSWRATRNRVGPPTLAQAIAARPEGPDHARAAQQLRGLLGARLSHADRVEGVVGALIQFVREAQAILATTSQIQDAINTLLERPRPQRPLGIEDLWANYGLAGRRGAFPYLFESLDAELGVRVRCAAGTLEVSDREIG